MKKNVFDLLEKFMPRLVIAPSFAISIFFIYGFILWTAYISLTNSKIIPKYDFAGFIQYFNLWDSDRWNVAFGNLFIFSIFFILIAIILGIFLAILLDQKIRTEGFIRTVYLYPMALSFIVTGTIWKWILNPGLGIEKNIKLLGFADFEFDWLISPDMAIYCVVIAAIWQSSGFVMSLFLAGFRSVNQEIIKAAMMEGASLPRIYLSIIIPILRPVFISAFVVLFYISIKSFDLILALTAGGPGYSTDMPATYMYAMAFGRGDLGQAASSALMMLVVVCTVMIPYLYSELRQEK